MPASDPRDIATMSFEEALDELQALVRKIEKGESKLDEAIQQYERGAALKQHCEAKLREAQAKIEKIVMTPSGSGAGEVAAEPADLG